MTKKFCSWRSFDALPPSCDELFRAAARQSYFLSRKWFETLAATILGENDSLRILGLEDDGRIVVLAVCCVLEKDGGRTLRSLSNFYTMEFEPLVADGATDPAGDLALVFKGALREDRRLDGIAISPVKHGEQPETLTQDALRRAGLVVEPYFISGNWIEKVAGRDFAAFFADRPSQLRNTHKRRGRKLEKEGRSEIRLYRDTSDLDEGIAGYEAVYGSSWKEPEEFEDFTARLMRDSAEEGLLRLGVLFIDGEAAAAQLWINSGSSAIIYKLAYKEEFRNLSVGTILSAYMFENAIDKDGMTTIDYGSGDDAYKKDWMTQRRENWGLQAYAPRSLSGLRKIAAYGVKRLAAPFRTKPADAAAEGD